MNTIIICTSTTRSSKMKAFLTLAAIVAAAQASEWEQFKAAHGKLYGSQGEVSKNIIQITTFKTQTIDKNQHIKT